MGGSKFFDGNIGWSAMAIVMPICEWRLNRGGWQGDVIEAIEGDAGSIKALSHDGEGWKLRKMVGVGKERKTVKLWKEVIPVFYKQLKMAMMWFSALCDGYYKWRGGNWWLCGDVGIEQKQLWAASYRAAVKERKVIGIVC